MNEMTKFPVDWSAAWAAVRILRKSCELRPGDAEAVNLIADYLREQGRQPAVPATPPMPEQPDPAAPRRRLSSGKRAPLAPITPSPAPPPAEPAVPAPGPGDLPADPPPAEPAAPAPGPGDLPANPPPAEPDAPVPNLPPPGSPGGQEPWWPNPPLPPEGPDDLKAIRKIVAGSMTIPQAIASLKQYGFSQARIARACDLDESGLSCAARGKVFPYIDKRFRQLFRIPPTEPSSGSAAVERHREIHGGA